MTITRHLQAICILVIIAVSVLAPTISWAQSPELMAANKEYGKLKKQAKYAEAIPFAEEVIELAKREFGTEHGYYSAGLSRLAVLYQDQGRHAEAEPLFKRALAIQNNIPTRLIQRLFICKIVFVYKIVPAVKGGVV